jgi:hypothetical protein
MAEIPLWISVVTEGPESAAKLVSGLSCFYRVVLYIPLQPIVNQAFQPCFFRYTATDYLRVILVSYTRERRLGA